MAPLQNQALLMYTQFWGFGLPEISWKSLPSRFKKSEENPNNMDYTLAQRFFLTTWDIATTNTHIYTHTYSQEH